MTKFNPTDELRYDLTAHSHFTGKLEYIHNKKCNNGTAYPSSWGISLLLHVPRVIGAISIAAVILDESCKKQVFSIEGVWVDYIDNEDVFEFVIAPGKLSRGLYFFHFDINGYSNLRAFKCGQNVVFKSESEDGERFQLTVYDFKYRAPEKCFGGIIYHIFVDRFNKGRELPPREDAVLISDWNEDIVEYPEYPGAFLKNNTFYGGTLYGVIDKLPYIANLGVTIIYLSPIFEAYSNHKYDTGDYSKVDEMFGGEDALRNLINKAAEFNIEIILDGVFNHTGSDSVYFNKNLRYSSIGAFQSKSSPYYEWYEFQKHPDKYTSWWGIDILPRIHPDVKSCSDFFIGENGIIGKYAKMGIAGFRLDVVDELSDSFVGGIKSALNSKNPTSVLYGEVWEDASNKIAYDKRKKYYLGDELDGVMNYPVRNGIIDYIKNKNVDNLIRALTEVYPNMPPRIRNLAMNLLGTHDTERILTVLGGASPKGKSATELRNARMSKSELNLAIKRLRSAYTILATLPGIPSIYYGDEAGMEGYSDPFNRRTFPWGNENATLLSHYKAIGKIRRTNSVYKEGAFELLYLTRKLLIFKREESGEAYITVYNNSHKRIPLRFSSVATNLLSGTCKKTFCLNSETATIFKSKTNNKIFFAGDD